MSINVPTRALFDVAGALVLVAAWIMAFAHHYCPRGSIFRAGALVLPTGQHARMVMSLRYARILLAIGMLAALAGLLIEFQFYLTAAMSGNSMRANARYFANFYLVLNVAALTVEVLLIPTLQRRLGVAGALFILPLILFGGATAVLVVGSGFALSFLRVAEGSLKSSIHRVSWEQAYLPLERAERAIAKLFIDGLGARIAEGAGALIVFLWLRSAASHGLAGHSLTWVGWMLLAIILSWLALTALLRRQLTTAERMGLLKEEPDIPVRDACVVPRSD
jgi:AAA family ATP:ADP antiporter